MGPSDSDRDCPSRRDSDTLTSATGDREKERLRDQRGSLGSGAPRLGVTAPSCDSESGGSHSPSPRASRRRQVSAYLINLN